MIYKILIHIIFIMITYQCDRCGYTTQYRQRFTTHLNRKRVCPPKISSTDIMEMCHKYGIIRKSKNNDTKMLVNNQNENNFEENYSCEYCFYKFNRKYNLNRHYKRCKAYHNKQLENINNNMKTNIDLTNRICELEKKTDKINTTISSVTTINNTIDNSKNSIIINNYGNEDLSYLTPEEMTSYVKKLPPGVLKFIEKIHFNPKHPENRNLRITNKKEPLIQIRKKNKWIFDDKMNVISSLLSDKYMLLEQHLSVINQDNLTDIDKKVINRFRNNYEDNVEYMKDLLKKVELLILNNSKQYNEIVK